METKTMSMLQFVPHEVKPIMLARDPQPFHYSPNHAKFATSTTTKDTYTGEMGERAVSLKPREPTIVIGSSDAIDTKTHYRDTFVSHGLTLCQSKAFLIAQSLSKRNENNSNNMTSNSVPSSTSSEIAASSS